MDNIVVYTLMGMLLPMAMVMGYAIGEPLLRSKILNKLTRGFYGIVILNGWGNNALFMVKNLKKDILHLGDDVYSIENRMIINLKKPQDSKRIDDNDIRNIGGVPFIELDKSSMIPVVKSTMKMTKGMENMLPGLAGANIKKEISIAEAEVFDKNKELIKKLLFVVLLISLVAAGVAAFGVMNLNNQQLLLQQIINNTLPTTTTTLPLPA